jgi:hypothetical protein
MCSSSRTARLVFRSSGIAGPHGKSPSRIVLAQLKRTFEGRHHSLQLTWETKRTSQVLFDCRLSHNIALRNQHSYICAAVHDHNVLVQILSRCNDAARFFEKGSVPTVLFRRNAGSVQLNIVLSFYGRKMQPIQSRAIILNRLRRRLTLRKINLHPQRPFRLSV